MSQNITVPQHIMELAEQRAAQLAHAKAESARKRVIINMVNMDDVRTEVIRDTARVKYQETYEQVIRQVLRRQ